MDHFVWILLFFLNVNHSNKGHCARKEDNMARSSNLPTAATMVGGTQLFEGAHLTGDNTHFFLESGRYSDYVFLTQMCPLKQ